ncbi:MAG TPA: hypothetical protein VFR75_01320 [Solirubrobacterales bacterium]|nr:hypothetical protein [Solirubrobacterales bacterium]
MAGKGTRIGALCLAFLAGGVAVGSAVVVQTAGVRVSVLSQVMPYKLPRDKPAPIAIFVGGHLAAVDGGVPPQLERLRIQVNRHGLLQSRGLPVCRARQVQPATTERALANCGEALIGSGQFWAHIILPGQAPYPTKGRLLIFNGRQQGRPTLLAQIYTSHPFNSSFLVNFAIRRVGDGPYGTELTASLPETLGEWGYLDRIKLTLKRKYRFGGRRLSYFNAACPAPAGVERVGFPLAKATFFFDDQQIAVRVDKACGVKE